MLPLIPGLNQADALKPNPFGFMPASPDAAQSSADPTAFAAMIAQLLNKSPSPLVNASDAPAPVADVLNTLATPSSPMLGLDSLAAESGVLVANSNLSRLLPDAFMSNSNINLQASDESVFERVRQILPVVKSLPNSELPVNPVISALQSVASAVRAEMRDVINLNASPFQQIEVPLATDEQGGLSDLLLIQVPLGSVVAERPVNSQLVSLAGLDTGLNAEDFVAQLNKITSRAMFENNDKVEALKPMVDKALLPTNLTLDAPQATPAQLSMDDLLESEPIVVEDLVAELNASSISLDLSPVQSPQAPMVAISLPVEKLADLALSQDIRTKLDAALIAGESDVELFIPLPVVVASLVNQSSPLVSDMLVEMQANGRSGDSRVVISDGLQMNAKDQTATLASPAGYNVNNLALSSTINGQTITTFGAQFFAQNVEVNASLLKDAPVNNSALMARSVGLAPMLAPATNGLRSGSVVNEIKSSLSLNDNGRPVTQLLGLNEVGQGRTGSFQAANLPIQATLAHNNRVIEQALQVQLVAAGSVSEDDESNLSFNSLGVQQQATPALAMNERPPVALPAINYALRQAQWENALGQRLMYMINQQVSQAQIQLNPAHLGPIRLMISLDRDQTLQVQMLAQHSQTKDAMEQALPRLREMLQDAGIKFDQLHVAQDTAEQGQSQFFRGPGAQAGLVTGQAGTDEEEQIATSLVSSNNLNSNTIDFYV